MMMVAFMLCTFPCFVPPFVPSATVTTVRPFILNLYVHKIKFIINEVFSTFSASYSVLLTVCAMYVFIMIWYYYS